MLPCRHRNNGIGWVYYYPKHEGIPFWPRINSPGILPILGSHYSSKEIVTHLTSERREYNEKNACIYIIE
jgi:hypothetical protein